MLLATLIILAVPVIVDSVIDIVEQIPLYMDKTQIFLIDLGKKLKTVDPNNLKEIISNIKGDLPKLSTLFAGYLGELFKTTFSVGKFIIQFVLVFVICFYILLEKEEFLEFSKKAIYVMCGKKYGDFTLEVCSTLNSNIGKYFTGKILDSFIVGVLSGIGLYFIKSQYALLFGVLIGFMNLIPYFGTAIAIIEPKIVGGQLGLSPFLTIMAVAIGGGFFGIPGMILSVPIIGVIKIYIVKFVEYKYKFIK